jgi:hypothetical protein
MNADAVIKAQLEYLQAGGVSTPRRRKLERKLSAALPALNRAEADMRRTFKRWDKARATVGRLERELERLILEQDAPP